VSAFSRIGYFFTGFPLATTQVTPTNTARDISLTPTLVWRTARGANAYQIQIASTPVFDAASIVIEAAGIADSMYKANSLELNKFYYWRIRATNSLGISNWSVAWRFKTIETPTAVAESAGVPSTFALYQNYPNPFNPNTTIVFDLPQPGTSQLAIYDALGQEVLTLLEEPLAAGRHEVSFYAYDLPSGIYYYRLKFDGRVLTKRMTILK